jgi:hypothetical protein
MFRVGAAQLTAAQGYVECGRCETQFNALERLADEPDFADQRTTQGSPPAAAAEDHASTFFLLEPDNRAVADGPARAPSIESKPEPEPRTVPVAPPAPEPRPQPPPAVAESGSAGDATSIAVEGHHQDTLFEVDPPAAAVQQPTLFDVSPDEAETSESTLIDVAPDAAVSAGPAVNVDPGIDAAATRLSADDHAILFTDPGEEPDLGDAVVAEPDEDEIALDAIPDVLKADVAALHKRPRSRWRWAWAAAALLLSLLFALQVAWVNREKLFENFPNLRPTALSVCAAVGCRLESRGDGDTVRLTAREVRDHPQYRDTLLVNATLLNTLEGTAPFPIIQLGLYDTNGSILGVRRFAPTEYLDRSIDIDAGMPPGRPVYIVLEVAGAGDQAVSFEFGFL